MNIFLLNGVIFINSEYMNKIVNDDCYNILCNIEDKSIDLILTDPPYNISSCGWDTKIDIDLLFSHYRRIIKDDGTIVVFGNNPFSASLIIKNIDIYKYSCVWVKPNSTSPHLAKKQPMKRYEDIIVFYKGKNKYNPVMHTGKPYKWSSKRTKGEAAKIRYKEDSPIINNGYRYPTNVFEFPQERGLHPTQKPVSLFEYIIRLYTNENDVVLDSFSGSGTTAVACNNTNRKFICIEKDKEIYDVSINRLLKKI